MLSPC
ncbi:Protein of unknown function [Bacillus cytotoxicus]